MNFQQYFSAYHLLLIILLKRNITYRNASMHVLYILVSSGALGINKKDAEEN